VHDHEGQPCISPAIVTKIAKAVRDGCSFLTSAGFATDAFAACSLVNCEGGRLVLGNVPFPGDILEWESVLTLPSVYLDDVRDEVDVMRQFRPMFDALWNRLADPAALTTMRTVTAGRSRRFHSPAAKAAHMAPSLPPSERRRGRNKALSRRDAA
jgi:hypothetical protein